MTAFEGRTAEIWQLVQRDFPGEDPIPMGDDTSNEVVVVKDAEQPYTLKIPRSDTAEALQAFYAEAEMYDLISGIADSAPLPVPTTLARNKDPAFAVFEYLPGVTVEEYLNKAEQSLTEEQQRDIGMAVGTFIGWIANACTLDRYNTARYLPPAHPYDAYMQDMLTADDPLSRDKPLFDLGESLFELRTLHERYRKIILHPTAIGHKDLHQANILVKGFDSPEVSGIIDFGNVQPSHPEAEMQSLLQIGPAALQGAIDIYQTQNDHELNHDLIRYWTMGKCVSSAVFCVNAKLAVPERVISTLRLLRPDNDWIELEDWNDMLFEDWLNNPLRYI